MMLLIFLCVKKFIGDIVDDVRKFEQSKMTEVIVRALKKAVKLSTLESNNIGVLTSEKLNQVKEYKNLITMIQDDKLDVRLMSREY